MISDQELKQKVDILTKKLNAGLFSEVVTSAKNLLKKRKHQILYNILCLAHQSLGQFDESITIMEEALRANPKNPHFLNNIGVSYYKIHDFTKAEYYFNRGLEIEPNYINILNNLGNLKKSLNLTKDAIYLYEKCLRINPKLQQTIFNLAISYESLGKFEKAKSILNELLTINKMFTEADRVIANITKYKKNDSHFLSMKEKMEDEDLSQNQKCHLFFGLGKYYEDINDYENSFINYSKGNDIIKKSTKYNIGKDEIYFDKIKAFNYNKLPKKNISSNRKIIFILGMPRSGTSLIEQILSSHKKVFGGGELPFMKKIIDNFFLNNNLISNLSNSKIAELINDANNDYNYKISHLDNSQKIFTDKTPLNFLFIGFIEKIFPDAKIINCNRNPMNICWSNFKNYFPGGLQYSNNLVDIGKYYKMYEKLIYEWEKKYPSLIHNIKYENLVEKPKEEVQKLLKFCDLEWDDNCLKHHENNRSIKTASSTQARQPIYKSAITASAVFDKYLTDLKKILNS